MKPIQMLYCLIQNTTSASQLPALRTLLTDAWQNQIIQPHNDPQVQKALRSKQRRIYSGKERRKHHALAEKREQAANCIYKNIQSSYKPEHLQGIKRLMQNAIKLGVIAPPDYLIIHSLYQQKEQQINNPKAQNLQTT